MGVNVGVSVDVNVGVKDGTTSAVLVSVGDSRGMRVFSWKGGRSVRVGRGAEVGEGFANRTPGIGEHPTRISPNINKRLFIRQFYFFLFKFSRSGISSAARRRMSKAEFVSKSRRLTGMVFPESAISIILIMLPRNPLARRAQ
jgi:hypothetical protein